MWWVRRKIWNQGDVTVWSVAQILSCSDGDGRYVLNELALFAGYYALRGRIKVCSKNTHLDRLWLFYPAVRQKRRGEGVHYAYPHWTHTVNLLALNNVQKITSRKNGRVAIYVCMRQGMRGQAARALPGM